MSMYSNYDIDYAYETLIRMYKERASFQARLRAREVLRSVVKDFLALAGDNKTPAASYLREKAKEWTNLCDNTEAQDRPASVWNFHTGTWSVEMSTLEGNNMVIPYGRVNVSIMTPDDGIVPLKSFVRDTDADGDTRAWMWQGKSCNYIIFND